MYGAGKNATGDGTARLPHENTYYNTQNEHKKKRLNKRKKYYEAIELQRTGGKKENSNKKCKIKAQTILARATLRETTLTKTHEKWVRGEGHCRLGTGFTRPGMTSF